MRVEEEMKVSPDARRSLPLAMANDTKKGGVTTPQTTMDSGHMYRLSTFITVFVLWVLGETRGNLGDDCHEI